MAGVGSLAFAVVWSIRLLRGSLKRGPAIAVRLWPLLAYIAMLLAGLLLASVIGNPFGALARFSPAAVGLMVATIVFALCTVWSAYALFRERRTAMNRWAYWSSVFVTALHVGVVLYLAAYGLIGVRTWA